MTEISASNCSDVILLLQQQKYEEALPILSDLMEKNPSHREYFICHLLVLRILVLRWYLSRTATGRVNYSREIAVRIVRRLASVVHVSERLRIIRSLGRICGTARLIEKLGVVTPAGPFTAAKLIKPKALIKALNKFKRKQTANPNKPAAESERSQERSSAELSNQNDEPAKEIAVLSSRLAENQKTLDEYESTQRHLMRAQTQNQQLQESKHREMEAARQQLEARIVDLKRDLFEAKNRVQVLDEARESLRHTERVCQELAEENRRLWEEVSFWQERLAASEENQRQANILRQQIHQLQSEYAQLINEQHQARAEFAVSSEPVAFSRLASDSDDPKVVQITANTGAELLLDRRKMLAAKVRERMPFEIAISGTKSLDTALQKTRDDESHLGSADSAAGIHLQKEEEAGWVDRTSVNRQWRFGAVAATVVVIAGAVAMGLRETKFSAPKDLAIAPPTSSQKYTIQAVSTPQKKPAPRLRGTFKTVRPTQVYSRPSENSALVANIGAGMKINVVDSSYGWLEIRSRHGRPPGFIRQEAAVRIA